MEIFLQVSRTLITIRHGRLGVHKYLYNLRELEKIKKNNISLNLYKILNPCHPNVSATTLGYFKSQTTHPLISIYAFRFFFHRILSLVDFNNFEIIWIVMDCYHFISYEYIFFREFISNRKLFATRFLNILNHVTNVNKTVRLKSFTVSRNL